MRMTNHRNAGSRPGSMQPNDGSRQIAATGPSVDRPDFPIVAIGASAGGLDACRKLIDALPEKLGMAFILVQHLDPNHDSLLVDLLANHTTMAVSEAADGVSLAPDHLYVIPPGAYLAVLGRVLQLSRPEERHGARLPFDFLLRSLAEGRTESAACIILSGTGADGSEGLKALKAKGGLVIAQDPDEADYDGMPRSAILTGAVDLTLKIAAMPAALATFRDRKRGQPTPAAPQSEGPGKTVEAKDGLAAIIDLLRARTSHDFTLYKEGTLRRRVERRIAMRAGSVHDMAGYRAVLEKEPAELELLAKDLLINVTSFFRDQKVFDYLAKHVVPDLVRTHAVEQPLRVWIAGCSTGEETYSLAMLLREEIAAAKRNIKLQIFASDVDADAVALAREGLYPETIAAEVSPERLALFFSKEELGYKVSPELRANIVFTVQDVLIDPPFSKIDLISCRNLLIYLGQEAQAKVISLFHFALRQGGLLLLGSSETAGNVDGQFEVVAKAERLYRRIGRARPGDVGFPLGRGDRPLVPGARSSAAIPSRQNALAELARRMALKIYAPAVVLINRKMECLYFLGPTARHLHHAEGHPTNDLLAMAPPEWRIKLRAAIQQVSPGNPHVTIEAASIGLEADRPPCTIEVHSIDHEGEELLLVGILEAKNALSAAARLAGTGAKPAVAPEHASEARVVELEQELEATRTELYAAIRNLELSSEEQKAVNEEALSVNEEFQSTNEELLTSKEELQSLNEELTALNGQLQETLDRQRTTSNDLQNVLFSTDVATLFLDLELNIRFFPSHQSPVQRDPERCGAAADGPPSDGRRHRDRQRRPLGARHARTNRPRDPDPVGRLVHPPDPALPHPGRQGGGRGDHLHRHQRDQADPEGARRGQAGSRAGEQSQVAIPRSGQHDLRQPLQTIAFVQGLLARTVEGDKARNLVKRLDGTLHAMSGMLNTLLDINQIEAGIIRATIVPTALNEIFDRMREEFGYHAEAKALALTVVPCSQLIETDPRLLEQVLRNLLTNAIKYTRSGKVLLGCRRRGGKLSIEIWDTGIGIPEADLRTIFMEYHQLDNAARERNRGLGLGLSIVQRLVAMLGCKVHVRSRLGKGSVFAIEIAMPSGAAPIALPAAAVASEAKPHSVALRSRSILVVEDDPDVRELLTLVLGAEGHQVTAATDGVAGIDLVEQGALKPDLVIADFNLPGGADGMQVAARVRAASDRPVPVVILTGDIATQTLARIARHDCVHLTKPVKLKKMMSVIEKLLTEQAVEAHASPPEVDRVPRGAAAGIVYVVDDDQNIRSTLGALLESEGYEIATFETCEAFLARYRMGTGDACSSTPTYRAWTGLRSQTSARHEGSAAGHHDYRRERRADGSSGDEGGSDRLHREAGGHGRTPVGHRARARAGAGRQSRAAMARRGPAPASPAHGASEADHGPGAGRTSQQEYRGRPRHQPAYRREPSKRHHDQDGLQIAAGPGASRSGRVFTDRSSGLPTK